ncbi:MAG: hypothetical protein BMS9Abin05_1671 [Rhodothermia bacterium]|nr:MAG: hypothetical protein BMS9Abin05_1671 [Rhodothermia bacterium]
MVGTTLSHYKIISEIGRGGMGIVYKAEDTKLSRTVAVKVLPAAALGNDEDKARFFREAQAAAQLQHANIATVYAIEEATSAGGEVQPFIAMEFIDGETLTERITQGPLKLEEARQFAVQVATALEAAHEKNIVHRDVKSGNVMITKKGLAKVLDFGLAKTSQSTKLTQLGSTLGTVAYMSPEQARGDEVDSRSDLWSLGVLLYEMVSGRLPFASEYEQAAVYSILNEDPEPLTALRADVPMALDWIVSKLLAKSESERYQNASDLLVDLTTLDLKSSGFSRVSKASGTRAPAPDQTTASTSATEKSWLWPVVATLAFAFGLLTMYFLRPSDNEILAWSTALEDGSYSVISPIGDRYAYVQRDTLWIRELSSITPRLVNNSTGAHHPFWSQDGSELGFFKGLTLWKVDQNGSNLQELSQITDGYINAATWLVSGSIVVSTATGTGLGQLVEVPGGGGETHLYSAPDSGFFSYRGISSIPGTDDVIAIIVDTNQLRHVVHVMRGNDRIVYTLGGAGNTGDGIVVSRTGQLLFENRGIWSAKFSASSKSVSGNPVRVLPNGAQLPSVSNEGTLLYSLVLPPPLYQFAWVDDEGTPVQFFGRPAESLMDPSVSPDEERVAVMEVLEKEAWIQDTRGASVPLTGDKGMVQRPGDWFADGQHILLWSFETGEGDIYVLDASGIGERQLLAGGPSTQWAGRLSPDEKWIAYYRITPATGRDVEFISLTREQDGSYTGGEAQIFVQTQLNESTPDFHPSGNFLSYQSDISGQWNVYVRSFPNPNEKFWTVTSTGAYQAQWHPNGRALYYVTLADTLMRVSFDPNASSPFGAPEKLFHIPRSPGQEAHTWPYTFGQTSGRLGTRVQTRAPGEPELVMIQNWARSLDD